MTDAQQTPTPDVVAEAGKQAIELLKLMLEWDGSFRLTKDEESARAIVALLPEPVDGDWFKRNANRRNPNALINTQPDYFASECASAIEGGTLVSMPGRAFQEGGA